MNDSTTVEQQIELALANLREILKFYIEREQALARVYLKHHSQSDLARDLGLTRQAISIRYSKIKEVKK